MRRMKPKDREVVGGLALPRGWLRVFLGLALLGAIFIPVILTAPRLNASSKYLGGNLTEDLSCNEGVSIDAQCLPDEYDNLTIDHLTVNTHTNFLGNVHCQTPIWPSCLDISGQGCSTIPLQESCMPDSVTSWNVTGPVSLGGPTQCDMPLDMSCIGSELSLEHLHISGNLTVVGSLVSQNIVEQDMFDVDFLRVNHTELAGEMTCSSPGSIEPDCLDISSKTCSSPLDASCIGDNLTLSKVTVTDFICLNTTELVGEFTCSPGTTINESCIPPHLEFTNVTVTDTLTCSSMNPDCVDISTKTCPGGALDHTCIPDDAQFNNIQLSGGTLTCPSGGSVSPGCIDISGETCSSPVDASCVDISGETCTSPVDSSCLPTGLALQTLSVSGETVLGTNTTCNAHLGPSCVDINGFSCPNMPLNANCIPENLVFNTLTVQHLNVLNFTETTGASYDAIEVDILYTNETHLQGPLTCEMGGYVDPDCVDISGKTCTAPMDESCIPNNIVFQNATVTDTLTFHNIVCTGDRLDPSCLELSNETLCSSAIPGSCIPPQDASSIVCDAPLGAACLPDRVATINSIAPAPGTLDFSLIAGTAITLTPGVNALTIASTGSTASNVGTLGVGPFKQKTGIDLEFYNIAPGSNAVTTTLVGDNIQVDVVPGNLGLTPSDLTCTGPALSHACYDISTKMCPGGAINADCVQIDGETCLAPIDDSCTPIRVKTINSILPNAGTLDFQLIAGTGISITPGTNSLTLAAIAAGGGGADTPGVDPSTLACQYEEFVSWSNNQGTSSGIWWGTVGNWYLDISGGGASLGPAITGINPTGRAIGVVAFDTGSSGTNRRVGLSLATDQFLFGYAILTFSGRFYPTALPIPSNDYYLYAGFLDDFDTAAEPTDGVYFKIDRALSATNWLLVARNNGVQTTTITSSAVSTTNFQTLRIEVNEAGTLATAYESGVSIGTVASNIPTAVGRNTGMGVKLWHLGGGGGSNVANVDFLQWCSQYSTPR